MLAKRKGEDINDAIQGPVGVFCVAIIIVGVGMFAFSHFTGEATVPAGDEADDPFKGLFGNVFEWGKYYLQQLAAVAVLIGAMMVAVTLRLVMTTATTHAGRQQPQRELSSTPPLPAVPSPRP